MSPEQGPWVVRKSHHPSENLAHLVLSVAFWATCCGDSGLAIDAIEKLVSANKESIKTLVSAIPQVQVCMNQIKELLDICQFYASQAGLKSL